MIRSEYCTLKVINLRDNFVNFKEAEMLKEALKKNRTITKLQLDYNPVKMSQLEQIEYYCKRNYSLDAVNQKNKNIYLMKEKMHKQQTQKQSLNQEIADLRKTTDKTLAAAREVLNEVETKQ